MKKHEIFFSIIKIPLDFVLVFLSFFIARDVRLNHDLPYIILPKQYISEAELFNFALFWAFLYISIFAIHSLYKMKLSSSKVKEFFDIIFYSLYFFIFFSAIVFFARDFLYSKELPRLIILFTTILSIIFVISSRFIINLIQNNLLNRWIIEKRKIVLLSNKNDDELFDIIEDIKKASIYEIIGYSNETKWESELNFLWNKDKLIKLIKDWKIDEIIFLSSDFSSDDLHEIWDYSRIYSVRYRYITNSFDITKLNTEISMLYKIPLIEIKNTPLDAWWRVIKRSLDFIAWIIWTIIFSPLMIFVAIAIKLEDPKWPIIYKNRRVWLHSKEFNLYKFRYMKWEYCIKDSYWISENADRALQYEKKLIEERSTRNWPLYKIENDPRKTKIGTFIEKYSIDELPQFFNVIIWNMSLVWPRPHQPREVNNYAEDEKRLLTIKPWITWMAQVNGRDKNDFSDEVKLDLFYIENWSILLDIKIIIKTFIIIIKR